MIKYIMGKKKILFLCTHNSARSQMAEGFVKKIFGDKYEVYSAGTQITFVRPEAIQVMKEIDIDISNNHSKHMSEFYDIKFDLVVTVCENAKKVCPIFPGAKNMVHYEFDDPSNAIGTNNEILDFYRKIRDQIKKWIVENLEDYLQTI